MGSISVLQAALIGIVYWIGEAQLPFVSLWVTQRPLVCGTIVGAILGDAVTGAYVGATINLVYLGFISAGGSMPADMALAGCLGVTYAICGNLDANTALSIAVPLGLLGTIVWYIRMTVGSVFVHMADAHIAQGKFNMLYMDNVILPQLMSACICAIPCGLAAYFGAGYVQGFIDFCAGKPMTIFSVIGGIMPALGIGITLQYIFKGEAIPFLFLGFMAATCTSMSLIEQGIVGLLVAVIYTILAGKGGSGAAAAVADDYDPDDE